MERRTRRSLKLRRGDRLEHGELVIECQKGTGLRVVLLAPASEKYKYTPRKALRKRRS